MNKSQSCGRCLRTDSSYHSKQQQQPSTAKKPESYLSKKFDELYKQDSRLRTKKQKKIQQSAVKKEEQQLQGCTFQPEIKHNPEYYTCKDSFLKRELDWKQKVDRKIDQKREQLAQRQKQNLLFRPKISQTPILLKAGVKKSATFNYTNRSSYVEKKSYKAIHTNQKKLKQIVMTTVVQPFKHRRINTTADNTQRSTALKNSLYQQLFKVKAEQQKTAPKVQIYDQLEDIKEVELDKLKALEAKETHSEQHQQQQEQIQATQAPALIQALQPQPQQPEHHEEQGF